MRLPPTVQDELKNEIKAQGPSLNIQAIFTFDKYMCVTPVHFLKQMSVSVNAF